MRTGIKNAMMNARVVPPNRPAHAVRVAYESLTGATPGGVKPKTWP